MVQREHAAYSSTAFSLPKVIENMGLQTPTRVQHSLQANMGLVKRLSHTQTLKGHSSAVNALDWSSDGEVLLSGGDDCRVKLWSADRGKAVQSFDSVSPVLPPTQHCPVTPVFLHSEQYAMYIDDAQWLTLTCAGPYIKHIRHKVHAKHWQ